MVAKIDEAEALTTWQRQSALILALIGGLFAVALAAMGMIWQRRGKFHFRAMYEAEERYRATLMSVGDGVIVTDVDGRVRMLNPVAETLTGWRREEARGRPLDEVFRVIDEEMRQTVENPAQQVVREGLVVGLANHSVLVSRDGSECAIADSGAPVRDKNGTLIGVVLVFRDQTRERAADAEIRRLLEQSDKDRQALLNILEDEKRAKEALKGSEKRYRMLFENAQDGIALTDAKTGIIVNCNQALCHTVERDKTELVGQSHAVLHVPRNVTNGMADSFRQHQSQDEARTCEDLLLSKSGKQTLVEIRASHIQLNEREYLLGVFRDITERKKAEETLREAVNLMSNIINSSNDLIYVKDLELRILLCNKAYAQAIGKRASDLCGKTDIENGWDPEWVKGNPAKGIGGHEGTDLDALSGKTVHNAYDPTIVMGEPRVFDTVKLPLRNDNGEIMGLLGIGRDITERLRFEDQIRQMQKMEAIGQLAGGVAHDFNNILQAMTGQAFFARKQLKPEEPAYNDIVELEKAIELATSLTRQLLAFSRRQVLQPKNIDLNKMIANLLKILKRLMGENIDLQFTPSDSLRFIHADPGQIEQILINLCVNARDAMPEGGRIAMATAAVQLSPDDCKQNSWARPGRYSMFTLSDNGCGMAEETLRKMFEPFFTTKEQGKGTGLGLATVYGIVKQHDGLIDVSSQVGAGTTFSIYLPVAATDLETEKIPMKTEDLVGQETILVAEDERVVRDLTARILEESGYRILRAKNSSETVAMFEAHKDEISLVLLDLIMPGEGGVKVFEKLVVANPNIRVLFCSGYAPERP